MVHKANIDHWYFRYLSIFILPTISAKLFSLLLSICFKGDDNVLVQQNPESRVTCYGNPASKSSHAVALQAGEQGQKYGIILDLVLKIYMDCDISQDMYHACITARITLACFVAVVVC